MFPHELTDRSAFDIARVMLEGFDRHYRLFRQASAQAQKRFEQADWHGQQRAQRERIEFYDLRVNEAVGRLRAEFNADALSQDTWQQAKLHYIGLLTDHHQPELAETFFNSVTSKLLHRSYFRNEFLFVRPAVSTEYIENDEPASKPTYRAYYPTRENLREFFEVNRHYVVVAALKALADEGAVPATKAAEAIKKYGLNPDKPNPASA